MWFWEFPPVFFFKSKINLLSAKKAEKIADNKAQFELTIAYFHVFQGKNKNNKITLIIGPKPPTPTLFWDKKRYFGGLFPPLRSGGGGAGCKVSNGDAGTKIWPRPQFSGLKFQSPKFWGRRKILGSRTQFEFSGSQIKGAMEK